MKGLLLVSVLAFVLCATAFGYYDEMWRSDEELGPPANVHVIGIGQTNLYPSPELIYIAPEPWDRGYVFIWALDLLTGEVHEVTDEFYDIVTLPGKEPRLVDTNNNGIQEILFLGAESPGDPYHWYLYGYGASGAGDRRGYRRVSGPELMPSRPNPLRRRAQIEYQLPRAGSISLRIHDAAGRMVKELVSGPMEAGKHTVEWRRDDAQGRPVAAGTYFYVLDADGQELTRKVVVAE